MSKKSVEAFFEHIRSGKRETQQMRVYVHLSGVRKNLDQLRNELPFPHQSITSALSTLMDMGVVSQNDDGYFYQTPRDQVKFREMVREQDRYNKWLKLGMDKGWFQPNGTPKPPQPRRVVLAKQTSIFDIL